MKRCLVTNCQEKYVPLPLSLSLSLSLLHHNFGTVLITLIKYLGCAEQLGAGWWAWWRHDAMSTELSAALQLAAHIYQGSMATSDSVRFPKIQVTNIIWLL